MDIKQVLQGVKTWSTNSFYTKEEVNQMIGTLSHFEAVSSLPSVSEASGDVLYLVGPTGNGSDKYEEYVLSNGAFIKIGDTSIDLSGYVTAQSLNTTLANYTTTTDLNGKENISNKVTTLSNSSTDNQYPSAKCVYDAIGNIETLLASI